MWRFLLGKDDGNTSETIFAIGDGDNTAGAPRVIPVEQPGQVPRAVDAAINAVASRAPRGARGDESVRAPVVASQEEIILAERLRLELERKYLREPG